MIAERWLGDARENTCCIRTPNTNKKTINTTQNHTVQISPTPVGWVFGCGYFKHIWCKSKSPRDGWEMAGRWLWGCPWLFSKDCGCDSRWQHDDRKMTGWLAPPSSKYFVCSCRSPRDGWEMVGWLALAISNDFGEVAPRNLKVEQFRCLF